VILTSPVFGQEQENSRQQPAVADDHAERMRNGLELFRNKIRPLLIEQCAECHGQKRSEGGLNLLTRKGLLAGGETEPVVVPGQADKSLLVRLIEHQDAPEMPFDRPQLPQESLKAIRDWIDNLAPYDKPLMEGPAAREERRTITEADRKFWSFQPLAGASPPAVDAAAWCRTQIDRFILAKIEQQHLHPLPAASREKLIRRASLDLLGLPPSPEEIDAFANDSNDHAWESLVDRLLASPHYGERWGRHWLDIVRFAESYGFEHDLDNENAYHYRDFVIRALNDDMPFDQFVRWQLAGDELETDQPLARMATGFLAAGVHNADFAKVRVEQERYDELDDIASTIGTSLLGLSIGCARCHDHKYDPITQENYYQFITAFERTVRGEIELAVWPGVSAKSKVLVAGEGVPPLPRIYNPGPAFFETTWFLRRGDAHLKSHEVPPGFLEALMPAGATANEWKRPADSAKKPSSTFRRTALATWITDTRRGAGSLSARVIVNRLWQHHFDRGIVATPNDFGARGTAPTHPTLLDWLARELIQSSWSLKNLHRRIMTSATYRQDVVEGGRSQLDDELFRGREVRRLEAEAIRDSMLALSGDFDRRMYGPGTLADDQPRRSIYYKVKRSRLIRLMTLFDAPDALQGIGRRPRTTVAPQALALMNGPLVEQFAHALARRLSQEIRGNPDDAVRRAFQETLGRKPTDDELKDAVGFIQRQRIAYRGTSVSTSPAGELAFAEFCHALFCLNEFIYVE
jgi:mono/diheme cytochrome c family protein